MTRLPLKLNVIVGRDEIVLEVSDRSYGMTPQIAEQLRDLLDAAIAKIRARGLAS